MSGRKATIAKIAGDFALSVGEPDMPVPPGWVRTRLLDVARLESGHTPSRRHPEYWDGDVPWVGIKDARIHHARRIAQTLQRVTEEGLANSAARWLPADTVCLSRTASVGYVTILDRPMATSQDFVNWVCSDALDPEFLMRLFQAEERALKERFGKGSTHTTIYFPEVKAFHVSLPPLNEQRRIVETIEGLEAHSHRAKQALDAIPPLLERFRQSVLAAAFRGDLTADWRAQNPDVEPADKLLERIRLERRRRWEEDYLEKLRAKGKEPKDDTWKAKYKAASSPEGDLPWKVPASWAWTSVESVADVLLGRQRAPQYLTGEHSKPYLRVANVYEDGIRFDDVKEMDFDEDDFAKYRLQPGDILMSEGQSPELVGESSVYEGGYPDLCFQKTLHRMRGYPSAPSPVLMQQTFMALRRSGVFRRHASLTTSIAHLTLSRVKRVPFPIAPAAEQQLIRERLSRAWATAGVVEEELRAAQARSADLDRAVLAKAFRGELVPQDPNDEPASALLERIRAEASADPKRKAKRRRRKAKGA